MSRRQIQYVPGVPRWFTRILSWWNWRTRCARHGHTITDWSSCDHCGEWGPA